VQSSQFRYPLLQLVFFFGRSSAFSAAILFAEKISATIFFLKKFRYFNSRRFYSGLNKDVKSAGPFRKVLNKKGKVFLFGKW
jgi:hypothetical protein